MLTFRYEHAPPVARLVARAALSLSMASPFAVAQTGGDAAVRELLRQQEREEQLRERLERTPDVRLRPAEEAGTGLPPDSETPCFTIERIALDGSNENFDWALADIRDGTLPVLGTCLGTRGISVVMQHIQNALIARGLITTRVLAGPQDLRSGALVLTVVPGRIREVQLEKESFRGARLAITMPIRPGGLLNLRDIEQGLENLRRLPEADADIRIVPGEAPGESDLIVTHRQGFPLRIGLALDDSGSRATGKYMGALSVFWSNPTGLSDLLHLSLIENLDSSRRGTRGHSFHYSVPFGYWLASFNTSRHDYHQRVAGINQDYRYSGTSERFGIKLSRLIHRDATSKTTVSVGGYLRKSHNFLEDTEILLQRRRMAGWEASLAHRAFIRRATLELELNWQRGTGALGALRAPEEDTGHGTARPRALHARASLDLPFTVGEHALRYHIAARAQSNHSVLLPQDRFAIGGRHTVRGFDGEHILSGERGALIRNDLSVALGHSGQALYAGLDHGRVNGRTTRHQPGKSLTGAVVGLRGGYRGASWDVFVGWPLDKPDGFRAPSRVFGFNLAWSS